MGMQFGSLSLGGDSFDAPESTPSEEPAAPEPQPQTQTQAAHVHESISSALPSTTTQSASLTNGSGLFQQGLPQQAQPQQQSQVQLQHALPSSVAQTQPSVQTPAQNITSPAPVYGISNHQQQQQQAAPQQMQQTHQQYAQHGLPTHLDPNQGQVPQQPSPQQQHQISQAQQAQAQQGGQHSAYFRQPETPYLHSPTPPAGQGQDSPYGSFGQLGHGLGHHQQQQHQAQNHLGGFGGDYGYADGARNFYDSYAQQSSSFGGRNALGHDDVKGLSSAQQQPSSASVPSANSQTSQSHPSSVQSTTQPQAAANQGPQQGYPPPLPYYYPYPQNQYYGTPYNSGYGVPQPFVKYPAMFQPPPGPGSAPSPVAKQPSAVPPQSNPYGQNLYGQQQYDESGYQHHTQQHQHQHGHAQNATNLPSNDYGKHQQQLYGGAQGMQGFMGLGQSTPSAGPPIGQRAGGGSPEASYKPYAPNVAVKDVGAGVGINQGGGGQQPQTRGGQQQGQGAFYGANRFGAGSTGGGPQGQQTQQHQAQGQGPQVGYPQGNSDGNFYSYQQRQQQQGYWQ